MDNRKIAYIICLIIWSITGIINLVFRKKLYKLDYFIVYALLMYWIILRIIE